MTSSIAATGPLRITSLNLTFFEVRVFGAFVGSFSNLATALGTEAETIMNLVYEEIHGAKEFQEDKKADEDRLFKATWIDGRGKQHVRYAAYVADSFTDAFKSIEDVMKAISTSAPRF